MLNIWPWTLRRELRSERERREHAEAQLARLRRAVGDLPGPVTLSDRRAGRQEARV